MNLKKRKVLGGFNRFRVMLTLGLAVLLPAAGLIYVNYSQLREFERDKVLEAAIHRDFQEMLAITEKKINKKAFALLEEARDQFPIATDDLSEREEKLDQLLANSPWFTHAYLYDEHGFVLRTQHSKMTSDKYVREEHERLAEYEPYYRKEGASIQKNLFRRAKPFNSYTMPAKRKDGEMYVTTVTMAFPQLPKDKVMLGGVMFDGCYLQGTLFPEVLSEMVNQRGYDGGAKNLAMIVYPSDVENGFEEKAITSLGWGKGKPEVSRKFDGIFAGLVTGIKYQGTSVAELGKSWMHRSLAILGCLSLMIIGGLVLTKHMVGKELAIARLKSDFVSNVSHELRTPLALIRLYAETLELGRISSQEKKEQYYRIIRKESERLTALINNILDFSRIEAGRKEYEFRETDIAELVSNTLDSYRYQIEQQGFALEEKIESNLPAVKVDREAIARALVNLVNNALKYSDNEKFLGVKLYRENGVVKLEVADHGIGIARRDQTKIFEKFYRAGDPLVHNTKGSGLGLSLVRHITHAHGGQIAVESIPGRGSKFILSLPVAPLTQEATTHAA